MNTSRARGFTLIELLVVIAIIGLLASVILASLSSARAKGRDARRIADLNQLQNALALYYDNHNGYPTTLAPLVTAGTISVIPTDPTTGASYLYAALGTACTGYHLGTTLETDHTALDSDADASAGTACSGSTADFAGTDPIYDVRP